MFYEFKIKEKEFLFLPVSQYIFEYSDEILKIAKDIENEKIKEEENYNLIKEYLQFEENKKNKLEEIIEDYNTYDNVNLSGAQINVVYGCNLSCKYCFAGDGAHRKNGSMTNDISEKIIDFILEHKGKDKLLKLGVVGGEPFLNINTFENILKYTNEILEAKDGVYFHTTTNGTLFNDRIIELFNKYNVDYMVSLDSNDKNTNDLLRVHRNPNQSTYDEIIKSYNKYKNLSRYDSFHITATPYNKNISEIAENLYELGVYHVQIDQVKSDDNEFLFNQDDIDFLKQEYEKLTDIIINYISKGVEVSCYPLTTDLGRLHKKQPVKFACTTPKEMLAFDPEGNIYPCDMLMWDDYKLGNINEGIDKRKLSELKHIFSNETDCRNCWARYLCGGECLADKLWNNEEQKKLRCELRRHIFKLKIYIYDYILKNHKNFNFEKY